MKIDIITLFPDMFSGMFEYSIISRAVKKGLVEINVHQLRDWAMDKHQLTDDRPFGGGPGMVLKPEPLFTAVEGLKKENSKIVLMSPQGQVFGQKKAQSLKNESHLIIVCGRYEGVDQRFVEKMVDEEISIGDYILSGGEPAANVVVDAIVRLIPGAIGKEESLDNESFNDNLLDYPVYTQPAEFRGLKVPEVLLSGHHGEIDKWRKEKAKEKTRRVRPELWDRKS